MDKTVFDLIYKQYKQYKQLECKAMNDKMNTFERVLRPYRVKNAIIMAAGLSSRFTPLSYEIPKPLLTVKGEVLIERQIKQLHESGINEIAIVVGYKKEMYQYLVDKFGVELIENPEYLTKNNHSSLYYVREKLGNTYICSGDNYFVENVFESHVWDSYYAAVYKHGETNEWCLTYDDSGLITAVDKGGKDKWVMLGHAYFSYEFAKNFSKILENIYDNPLIKDYFWEDIFINYIDQLPMYIKKYEDGIIFEFDTLEELREFDHSYIDNTNSRILKNICIHLKCKERDIHDIQPIKENNEVVGFSFRVNNMLYSYFYNNCKIMKG